jgi:hypothetical protein
MPWSELNRLPISYASANRVTVVDSGAVDSGAVNGGAVNGGIATYN